MEKLNLKGLQELFGRALLHKLTSERSFKLGKHYRTRGGAGNRKGVQHPAGTKLVRRFIRRGNTENTKMRVLYAYMTGHQYGV